MHLWQLFIVRGIKLVFRNILVNGLSALGLGSAALKAVAVAYTAAALRIKVDAAFRLGGAAVMARTLRIRASVRIATIQYCRRPGLRRRRLARCRIAAGQTLPRLVCAA
jgi:hypothetical protein